MSIIDILLSVKFLIALIVYAVLIAVMLPFLGRIHDRLEHNILQWKWDHVALPLIQVSMLILFILLAYPVIFGIQEAPSIILLLSQDGLRINHLVNLLFVISLMFPLIPVIGNWHELILPMQGIAASMMIFSWLAARLEITQYDLWPDWNVIVWCMLVGIITHWLAVQIAHRIGHKLDKTFNVLYSGELFSRGLILLMQAPVILIFSSGLGKQL